MKLLLIVCLLPAFSLAQIPGGIKETKVSPTDEKVKYAVEAINDYFLTKGDQASRTLVNVVRAAVQVVAGEKLYLTLHITGGAEDEYCKVDIWFRAWLENPQERLQVVSPISCSTTPPPARRQVLAGGIGEKHLIGSNPPEEVLNALNFAACAQNDRSNSLYYSVLDGSYGVYTQQVTSGITYRFYGIWLSESTCRKTSSSACSADSLQLCQLKEGGMRQLCDIVIQWQAWLTPQYTLTKIDCS